MGEPTSSEPMSSDFNTNSRPGTSLAKTGGVSRPTKSRWLVVDLPLSMPINEPDSSVPMPDTVPPEMRGRTTQKRVLSTSISVASLTISAVATTRVWSLVSVTLLTTPMSTFLNLILVLPASSPSPVAKVIVMVGPCSMTAFTASQQTISTAMIGTSQISCSRQRGRGVATASGISGESGRSGGLAMILLRQIPDQARVKRHRGKHGQNDDRAKGNRCRTGLDRRERIELNKRDEHRDDVDVEHRPASDQLDDTIDARPLLRLPSRVKLGRSRQVHQRDDLQHRHRDTRDEHDDCERPGA